VIGKKWRKIDFKFLVKIFWGRISIFSVFGGKNIPKLTYRIALKTGVQIDIPKA
jgi:hypothetical protein